MSLFSLLIAVVLLGLLAYLLWWAIGAIGLPAPFDKVARVIVIVICIVALIGLFTGQIALPAFRL
jgi:hypothetical protein